MTTRQATFYLEPDLRQSAEAGTHNFIGKIAKVLRDADFDLAYRDVDQAHRAAHDDGYALFHMTQPIGTRGLTFRRVYEYPFWQIETTAERWDWTTAKTPFSAETVPETEVTRFAQFWRKRMFGPSAKPGEKQGFIYVPLQGRIREHRSFQNAAPMAMLRETLRLSGGKTVRAGLHPKEQYDDHDIQALEDLSREFPNLSIQIGGMQDCLMGCDFVVTMNSAAAFFGYFFGKPAVLWGKIDFHHIALTARPDDLTAYDRIMQHRPNFDAYLWWFWQKMSINAGRPEAEEKIKAALIRGGWPL